MQIKDYLNDILAKISANPYVESQNISFYERPPDAAYISGSVILIDGSQFHIKEFVLFKSEGVRACAKITLQFLDQIRSC